MVSDPVDGFGGKNSWERDEGRRPEGKERNKEGR